MSAARRTARPFSCRCGHPECVTGHHHGCAGLRRVRVVRRCAGAFRYPRGAALPVVPMLVQPIPPRRSWPPRRLAGPASPSAMPISPLRFRNAQRKQPPARQPSEFGARRHARPLAVLDPAPGAPEHGSLTELTDRACGGLDHRASARSWRRVADVPGIWAGPARRQRARRRSARAASAVPVLARSHPASTRPRLQIP
jgi:hypothetical protein